MHSVHIKVKVKINGILYFAPSFHRYGKSRSITKCYLPPSRGEMTFPHLLQPRIKACIYVISILEVLREHKPPPIRRIRISDFGVPDLKRDPDRHQNCITWSLSHALPLQKFRHNPFTSLRVIRRTDRQTDRTKNITSFFGGGSYKI